MCTVELVAAHPWEFLCAKIQDDVIDALWTRLKDSRGNMQSWNLASAGVAFFGRQISHAIGSQR